MVFELTAGECLRIRRALLVYSKVWLEEYRKATEPDVKEQIRQTIAAADATAEKFRAYIHDGFGSMRRRTRNARREES